MSTRTFYRRHLPHYQPSGATFHVVARLAGSLPSCILQSIRADQAELEKAQLKKGALTTARLAQERKHFAVVESALDAAGTGPRWLAMPEIADIVRNALHHRDGKAIDLLAYTIMPNHIHLVLSLLSTTEQSQAPLESVMAAFKRYTATQSNRRLGRTGSFWQAESYDRAIRSQDELERTIRYVMNNPVKAGLVATPSDWPWTYVKGLTP